MPETSSANQTSNSKATNNTEAGSTTSKKPKKAYVDPVRNTNYQDPLRKEIKRYEGTVKIPEFKPYTGYHEFKPPDIDPLTGKPRRKRAPKPKPEPKPEVVQEPPPKEPEPVESVPEPEPEPEPEREPSPEPTPEPDPPPLLLLFGNSTGSVKRSMDIMSNYDFSSPVW